jgi:hypothetical protein
MIYSITNSLSTAIAQLGVETVKANLDDPASYAPALEGLYGAFVNTDCSCRCFSSPHLTDDTGSLGPVFLQWYGQLRGG